MRHSVISTFLVLAFVSTPAVAHIRLEVPKGRYLNDPQQSTKQKQAPCGVSGDSRVTDKSLITTFMPGEKVTVQWTETVNHPGHFRIAFLEKGQEFPAATVEPMPASGPILADDIPDTSDKAGGMFKHDVTLPNMTCDDCTLQLIQVMSDSKTFYYQCADLILAGDAAGGSGGTGGTGGGGASATGGKSGAGAGGVSGGGGTSAGGSKSTTGGSGGTAAGGGGKAAGGGGGSGGVPASSGGTLATGGTSTPTGGSKASGSGGTPAAPTGGTQSMPPAPPADEAEGGCGFRTPRGSTAIGLIGLGAAAALLRRRRSRASRRR